MTTKTHPSYAKMVVIAVDSLKQCSKKDIKKHIKRNYAKIASGTRFETAIQSGIKNAINNKYLTLDKTSNKYKLTVIGKIKLSQPNKTRKKKNKVKINPRKKKRHETATGRTTCCNRPGHKFTPKCLYAGIRVMNKAIETRKNEMAEWEHGLHLHFNKLDFNRDGCLVKYQVKLLMIQYVGYSRAAAHEKIDDIMKICDPKGVGKITFQQFLLATAEMHRFVIYRAIQTYFREEQGCYWYGTSHALPGLFRIETNKKFPNKY
eukprot:777145_1